MIYAGNDAGATEDYRNRKTGMKLAVQTTTYGGVPQTRPILCDLGNVEHCQPLYNQMALLVMAHVVATLTRSPPFGVTTPGEWKGPMFGQPGILSVERLIESAIGGGTDEIAFQVGLNVQFGRVPNGCKEVSGMQKACSGLEELGSLLFFDYRQMVVFNGTYMTCLARRVQDGLKLLRQRRIELPNRAAFNAFLVHVECATGMLTFDGGLASAS